MTDLYYYYSEFDERIKTSKRKFNDTCFETQDKALDFYKKAEKEALKLFKQYKKEYDEFMKDKPYSINYVMKGDTHGIYKDYLSLNIKHKGFSFAFKMEN